MVYFSADYHFSHRNIIRYCNRPFSSIEEMNQTIIDNVNSVVGAKDTLYFLGDWCMGGSDKIKSFREQINSNHLKMVLGNHDKGIKPGTLFESVKDIDEYKCNGIHIVMCHYAFRSWKNSCHGSYHIFGHSHNTLPNYGLSFDCGIDGHNFMPWSLDEVVEKMNIITIDSSTKII